MPTGKEPEIVLVAASSLQVRVKRWLVSNVIRTTFCQKETVVNSTIEKKVLRIFK